MNKFLLYLSSIQITISWYQFHVERMVENYNSIMGTWKGTLLKIIGISLVSAQYCLVVFSDFLTVQDILVCKIKFICALRETGQKNSYKLI